MIVPLEVPADRILVGATIIGVVLDQRRAGDGRARDNGAIGRNVGNRIVTATAATAERHLEAALIDPIGEVRIESIDREHELVPELRLKRGIAAKALEPVRFVPALDAVHALGSGARISAIAPGV